MSNNFLICLFVCIPRKSGVLVEKSGQERGRHFPPAVISTPPHAMRSLHRQLLSCYIADLFLYSFSLFFSVFFSFLLLHTRHALWWLCPSSPSVDQIFPSSRDRYPYHHLISVNLTTTVYRQWWTTTLQLDLAMERGLGLHYGGMCPSVLSCEE